jgi:hypothetical protein
MGADDIADVAPAPGEQPRVFPPLDRAADESHREIRRTIAAGGEAVNRATLDA